VDLVLKLKMRRKYQNILRGSGKAASKNKQNCLMFISQIETHQSAVCLYMFGKQGHVFVTVLRKRQLFTFALLKAHTCAHAHTHLYECSNFQKTINTAPRQSALISPTNSSILILLYSLASFADRVVLFCTEHMPYREQD
jgi:hypothetical protein